MKNIPQNKHNNNSSHLLITTFTKPQDKLKISIKTIHEKAVETGKINSKEPS